jgi:prepilin-type N-terminal cleavage/methylation domain-containing protein
MILKKGGFTLVEIMIVSAIVSMITAVAVPNYFKARNTVVETVCRANAKQLQAILVTADLSSASGIPMNNLSEAAIKAIVYPNFISPMPRCSIGNYYTDLGGNVMCSVHNTGGAATGNGANNGGNFIPGRAGGTFGAGR